MNRSAAFVVKGWCPGALRPMQSGDGLIVRVRPPLGVLSPAELLALADAAARFGNGHLDLTRRANVQIRGIAEASLPDLYEVIGGLGLLDHNPESEAIRNIVINPLTGIDPTETLDVRNIAGELSHALVSQPSLWRLPGKFGFVVDSAGAFALAEQRADIRLTAIRQSSDVVVMLGIDTPAGVEWLGSVSPSLAAPAAIAAAYAFLETTSFDLASPAKPPRMRDITPEQLSSIRTAIKPRLDPLIGAPAENAMSKSVRVPDRVGLLDLGPDHVVAGIAAPFGGLHTEQLRQLMKVITAAGVHEIRLSPWRTLYVQVPDRQTGQAILGVAHHEGFVVDAGDPLLRIEACPGAPACPSTGLDTRRHARRLAEMLPRSVFSGSVHVSGCAKGCAKSGASDLVLVGDEDSYGIVLQGRSHDPIHRRATFAELASNLDAIVHSVEGGKP